MFLLGGCWVWDPPREFLGLRGHILVQFCKSNVKTPQFVGAENIDVKES